MRKDNRVGRDFAHGEYFGDFFSEPDQQVHSQVFVRDIDMHIWYYVKEGYAFSSLTDEWLSEIFMYMTGHGCTCEEVLLHRRAQDFSEQRDDAEWRWGGDTRAGRS